MGIESNKTKAYRSIIRMRELGCNEHKIITYLMLNYGYGRLFYTRFIEELEGSKNEQEDQAVSEGEQAKEEGDQEEDFQTENLEELED